MELLENIPPGMRHSWLVWLCLLLINSVPLRFMEPSLSVTNKVTLITIYMHIWCSLYSESTWSRECFGIQFISINSVLTDYCPTRDTWTLGVPSCFTHFFHTLDESTSYWRTICGLELCFVVFFSIISVSISYIVCELLQKCVKFACNYF